MYAYRKDEPRTAVAYELEVFKDSKQRSYYSNTGHVFLRGRDRIALWSRVYRDAKGLCAACGLWRPPHKLDLDHVMGNTPRTRCDCFGQRLNDGSVCFGVRLLCTMDPHKGGGPKSCHAKRTGREIRSDKKERSAV
jgi:hypothetical protein